MRNCIYLVHADTLQNTLKRMTEEVGQALEALGFETRPFNPITEARAFVEALDRDEVAGILSLNIYGFETHVVGQAIAHYDVPVFFFSTDHPYLGREGQLGLIRAIKRLRISLTGESELAAARRLHPGLDIFTVLRQGTAPHEPAPWEKRDIPNLVVGNNPIANNIQGVQDPEVYRALWPRSFGTEMAGRLNRMVEIHAAAPLRPMLDVIDEALECEGRAEPASPELICDTLNFFDIYQRTRVRSEGLRQLAGHPGVICGLGWDYLRDGKTRAHFLGSVPSNTVLELARRARAIYNLVPHYYSCSERVLEAATLGTPVVSTPSAFFEREFGSAIKTIADGDALTAHLEQPEPEDMVRERVARARAIVLERHTWAERARHIAEFFHSARRAAA